MTTASIIETSPRAAGWQKVFGRLSGIPIKGPFVSLARHKDVGIMGIYELDLSAITADERERLIDLISEEFSIPRAEVASDLDRQGVPIRAEDVLVSIPQGLALSMMGDDPFDLEDEVVDWQDDHCGWDGEDDDDDF